jgi:hypothetical protein
MVLGSYSPEPKLTDWYMVSITGSVIAAPAKLYRGGGEQTATVVARVRVP